MDQRTLCKAERVTQKDEPSQTGNSAQPELFGFTTLNPPFAVFCSVFIVSLVVADDN